MPDIAAPFAAVVATGRSDFPNQVNNLLAFPGIFRGALDVRASRITDRMKLAPRARLPPSSPTTSAAPNTSFPACSIRASSTRSPSRAAAAVEEGVARRSLVKAKARTLPSALRPRGDSKVVR